MSVCLSVMAGTPRPSSSPLRVACQAASFFLFLLFIKNTIDRVGLPLSTSTGFLSAEEAGKYQVRTEFAGLAKRTEEVLQNPRHPLSTIHGGERRLLNLKDDLHEAGFGSKQEGDAFYNTRDQDHVRLDLVQNTRQNAFGHPDNLYVSVNGEIHTAKQEEMSEISTPSVSNASSNGTVLPMEGLPCEGVTKHIGFATSCDYVRSIPQCKSASVIDYTRFFFCTCNKVPVVGYVVLIFWLLILFYSLGNTAADYFCCSLEKLSKLLNCPPTVAGVFLLPLGNGAPDVFASIAAFVGAGVGQVGLNSVLGGGVFVTTMVAGLVSLLTSNSQPIQLDKRSFVRDVCFYLLTIAALMVIFLVGKVHLWSALAFLSIYGLYAIAVAASELIKRKPKRPQWSQIQLLPFTTGPSVLEEDDSMYNPLLDSTTEPTAQSGEAESRRSLPQWRWASNVAIYSHQSFSKRGETARPPWGWREDQKAMGLLAVGGMLACVLQWPLSLPRRLTIPVVEDERWSRKFSLASTALAPVFFVLVLDLQEEGTSAIDKGLYIGAVLVGVCLATLAYFTTKPDGPPRRFLLPWVVGGFFMSIVWFFVIANELVALLVTFGTMLEIDPSILGLTVLAWGNSMGDLMANIALAGNGGDGVQIAISGCYAGPMFNTLIGLGLSFVLGSWGSRPHAFAIPRDNSIYYTMGFLVVGLLWALIILPLKKMQPNRLLGAGLLVLYASFLMFRLAHALGFIPAAGW